MSDTTNTTSGDDPVQEVLIAWAPIYVTLLVSMIQGLVLFFFFKWKRGKDAEKLSYELFEPRQFTRGHRSPPPFEKPKSWLGWAWAAYDVRDDVLLKNIGLDAYMFIRFLRLSARMTFLGSILSLVLIPLYGTGEARGDATEEFNQLTLARVGDGSDRLWGTLISWIIFIAFTLVELWNEWKEYAIHRYEYLAKGDVDTPQDYRYTIRVENIPHDLRTNGQLYKYFSGVFPNQVCQVAVCLNAKKIHALIVEREKCIVAFEKAVAFTKAKPQKPAPTVKIGASMMCCGGTKVDAIPHYQGEIKRLNQEIDSERALLYKLANGEEEETNQHAEAAAAALPEQADGIEQTFSGQQQISGQQESRDEGDEDEDAVPVDGKPSSTAFVTMTSLRAKQAAIQCEISGKKDRFDVFAASEPNGVIWDNVTMPLSHQKLATILCAAFWMVGILFWAFPVTFVTSIANLNGILSAVGLQTADPNAFWYGFVAGVLPVVFLQILMIVLYMAINMAAKKIIRKKSMPEVEAYAIFWHQMYQFANLWLILIGGSLFSQLDALLKMEVAIPTIIADAMPGASIFFMNMIIVGSFGAFGMELSMLPTYGVALIMNMIQPAAQRTQRALDNAKNPPTITWGKTIPKIVFCYLVSILYMPIVPIVEVFAFLYFGGMYVVYKHQCLHVYATEFEGGGSTTWESIFGFLMSAIYIAEVVFIAYLGAKKAPIQAGIGFVPLIVTIIMHFFLNRNIRAPLANLSLQVAAEVDAIEGEKEVGEPKRFSEAIETQLFGQPDLKTSMDEREPLPYRRDGERAVGNCVVEPSFMEEGVPDSSC